MKLDWHQEERWNAKGADNYFLKVYPTMNNETFSVSCTHMDDEGSVESMPVPGEFDTHEEAQEEAEKWLEDHLSKIARARAKKAAATTAKTGSVPSTSSPAKTGAAGNGG